ncbi:MAG: hypothetical protein HZC54_24835 [Verrucomicrobia bacterium]|nr:hypothetical protein [Verrucomicrobiota bacterium]
MNQKAQDPPPSHCEPTPPAANAIKPASPSTGTTARPFRFPVSRNPVFTGARLAQRNPEKYLAILDALKRGERVVDIAKRLRCSQHTVLGIRERAGDDLPLPTRMTGSWLAQLAYSRPGRMERVMAKMSFLQLVKMSCRAIDKATAIEGGIHKSSAAF